jgi:hypothetical protein
MITNAELRYYQYYQFADGVRRVRRSVWILEYFCINCELGIHGWDTERYATKDVQNEQCFSKTNHAAYVAIDPILRTYLSIQLRCIMMIGRQVFMDSSSSGRKRISPEWGGMSSQMEHRTPYARRRSSQRNVRAGRHIIRQTRISIVVCPLKKKMNRLPRKKRAMGKSLNKDQSKSRQIPDMDGRKDQNENRTEKK